MSVYRLKGMSNKRSLGEIEDSFSIGHMEGILNAFESIYLDEMEYVSLQDRMDTKYLIGISQLESVLPQLIGKYRALEINRKRLNHYRTLYFDTNNFDLYYDHHNSVGSQYKVRARQYVESKLAFFEVKHKTNRKRTVKSRVQIPDVSPRLSAQLTDFIQTHTPFDAAQLQPKVWNDYQRLTLVSKAHLERLTIDFDVLFRWEDVCETLPGIVIIEVKQKRLSLQSDFIQQMRQLCIRPLSYSKYTAGIYMLYNNVKANNFKAQIRQVEKVIQRELCHESVH
jgi:hypothetical protein